MQNRLGTHPPMGTFSQSSILTGRIKVRIIWIRTMDMSDEVQIMRKVEVRRLASPRPRQDRQALPYGVLSFQLFVGTIFPTRRKRYTDPETGLRIKWTNRKYRIPIELYPCRVEEKFIMRELEGEWIMKKEIRMISKDGTISKFLGYTSSKEEEDGEEEEEEEKEEEEKKRSKEASQMRSNSEPPGYVATDNDVESDHESTARSEPKCKEMEDTCESDIRPKPDSF
ncbi:hypothetical protein Tco_0847318 [Tanacetum coccineum]